MRALSTMFRGKYIFGLQCLYENDALEFHGQVECNREVTAYAD